MSDAKEINLSFDQFISRLKEECEYHKDGGTSYRQETSRLSLNFALDFKKVTPFLDLAESRKLVSIYYPSIDFERKNDVGKMLHVIAKSLYVKEITTPEAREYVRQMMKHYQDYCKRK